MAQKAPAMTQENTTPDTDEKPEGDVMPVEDAPPAEDKPKKKRGRPAKKGTARKRKPATAADGEPIEVMRAAASEHDDKGNPAGTYDQGVEGQVCHYAPESVESLAHRAKMSPAEFAAAMAAGEDVDVDGVPYRLTT